MPGNIDRVPLVGLLLPFGDPGIQPDEEVDE